MLLSSACRIGQMVVFLRVQKSIMQLASSNALFGGMAGARDGQNGVQTPAGF